MIAMIGTSDRLCWLAETCKILLLLLRPHHFEAAVRVVLRRKKRAALLEHQMVFMQKHIKHATPSTSAVATCAQLLLSERNSHTRVSVTYVAHVLC